jgi:rsbT co-antagonist protein RsbR
MARLPDPISIFDLEGNYLWWNRSVVAVTSYSDAEMESLRPTDLFAAEDRDRIRSVIERVVADGTAQVEATLVTRSGERIPFEFVGALLRGDDGAPFAISTVGRDVTHRKQVERRLEKQAREILELSTPAIEVWEGIVAVPLIGTLDSERTERFAEGLLEAIVVNQVEVALIDVTGVPAIDTMTAHHILETIAAVRLLGARVVLTGVRPAIAQTLVHLGIDLSGVITRSSLAAGLRKALEMIGA